MRKHSSPRPVCAQSCPRGLSVGLSVQQIFAVLLPAIAVQRKRGAWQCVIRCAQLHSLFAIFCDNFDPCALDLARPVLLQYVHLEMRSIQSADAVVREIQSCSQNFAAAPSRSCWALALNE